MEGVDLGAQLEMYGSDASVGDTSFLWWEQGRPPPLDVGIPEEPAGTTGRSFGEGDLAATFTRGNLESEPKVPHRSSASPMAVWPVKDNHDPAVDISALPSYHSPTKLEPHSTSQIYQATYNGHSRRPSRVSDASDICKFPCCSEKATYRRPGGGPTRCETHALRGMLPEICSISEDKAAVLQEEQEEKAEAPAEQEKSEQDKFWINCVTDSTVLESSSPSPTAFDFRELLDLEAYLSSSSAPDSPSCRLFDAGFLSMVVVALPCLYTLSNIPHWVHTLKQFLRRRGITVFPSSLAMVGALAGPIGVLAASMATNQRPSSNWRRILGAVQGSPSGSEAFLHRSQDPHNRLASKPSISRFEYRCRLATDMGAVAGDYAFAAMAAPVVVARYLCDKVGTIWDYGMGKSKLAHRLGLGPMTGPLAA